ncbi:MAG: hypothetical protein ABH950_01015 [Candidatus Altiarchaeota archaeon]
MGKRCNPWVAGGLSFIVGGLGQIYLREYQKATFFLVLELGTALLMISTHVYFWGYINFLISLTAALDAFRVARARRKKMSAEQSDNKKDRKIKFSDFI